MDLLNYRKAEEVISLCDLSDKVIKMNNSFDTQITCEFDERGVLLSGGEAQKLVIARALYHDAPIIILDEPSAAMDPISEYNLNHTILNSQSDKTVIMISHRLSTTRIADKIFMLKNGEIIESGTHDELMLYGGKYAAMFNMQAKNYNKNI